MIASALWLGLGDGPSHPQPIVPEGLAVVRIFAAEPTEAGDWLRATDIDDPGPRVQLPTPSAELLGVDEADFVAFEVVLTGQDAKLVADRLVQFTSGHHGYLLRVPETSVAALSRAEPTPETLDHVVALAAELRGKAKPADWTPLSIDDLHALASTCEAARGVPVFLHLSE